MGETYDLPRSEEEGCGAARGHHLERNTAFEIGRVLFPILEVGLVAVDEALDKGVILLLVHRAVDIILAVADRTDLVPAARHPCDVHVDALAVDDGGDGVEEGERVLARRGAEDRKSPRLNTST